MEAIDIKTETERVLRRHFSLYPAMEPQDAVKLLFQSEFGCAHLIADENRARAFLRAEWEAAPREPAHRRLDILGGGFVRVHLQPLAEDELEALSGAFVRSARPCGSGEGLQLRLETLKNLARAGETPFSAEALETYLESYIASGCPAVHHSEEYRRHYSPAYRVVKREYYERPADARHKTEQNT